MPKPEAEILRENITSEGNRNSEKTETLKQEQRF
jgi:hypothetical protein